MTRYIAMANLKIENRYQPSSYGSCVCLRVICMPYIETLLFSTCVCNSVSQCLTHKHEMFTNVLLDCCSIVCIYIIKATTSWSIMFSICVGISVPCQVCGKIKFLNFCFLCNFNFVYFVCSQRQTYYAEYFRGRD